MLPSTKLRKTCWMKDNLSKFSHIYLDLLFILLVLLLVACAGENKHLSESPIDDPIDGIINPLDATCYDWRDNIVPCRFQRPYAELMMNGPIPASRFIDNKDGTVTDRLTQLVWLKNMDCFGMLNWRRAALSVEGLKDGDCGPNQALILSDGSSAGDWRLPTMEELCILIDFSRREPALPNDHLFLNAPSGYHWSSTTLDHNPGIVWIVYIESGTTCYEDKRNRAGHVWPVRGPRK